MNAHFDRFRRVLSGLRTRGFTIIELLVAMAVLALMVVFFVQIVAMAGNTWQSGRAQANNFSQARVALGLMARDLEAMVRRADLPAFFVAGTPAIAFYTKQQSLVTSAGAGARPLSRISYAVTNTPETSVLRRTARGFNFTNEIAYSPASWSVPTNGTTFDSDIGPGILVMRHQFIATNGLNVLPADVNAGWTNAAPNVGVANLRAIVISLAVVDDSHLAILRDSGTLAQLQENFSVADPGALRSFASGWRDQMNDPSKPLLEGGVPPSVLSGLKIFETTVVLPPAGGGLP